MYMCVQGSMNIKLRPQAQRHASSCPGGGGGRLLRRLQAVPSLNVGTDLRRLKKRLTFLTTADAAPNSSFKKSKERVR